METKTPGMLLQRIFSILVAVSLFGFIAWSIQTGCELSRAMKADGDAYLHALRTDRIDDAYKMLSAKLQAEVSRDQFERRLATPQLRRARSHSWNKVTAGSAGHGCLDGGVTINNDGKSLTLYMKQERGRWVVHRIYYDEWDYSDQPWNC